MAIPEPTGDLARQKANFRRVREIFERLVKEKFNLDTLSMGMSDDLESAIGEGSTLVRIGTAIFGERRSRGNGIPPAAPMQKIRPAA
jgi:uncharacterized pyridoxal phosphate-containing UPF0001 family protein